MYSRKCKWANVLQSCSECKAANYLQMYNSGISSSPIQYDSNCFMIIIFSCSFYHSSKTTNKLGTVTAVGTFTLPASLSKLRSHPNHILLLSEVMFHHDKHFQTLNSLISNTAKSPKSDSHLCNMKIIAGTVAYNLCWSRRGKDADSPLPIRLFPCYNISCQLFSQLSILLILPHKLIIAMPWTLRNNLLKVWHFFFSIAYRRPGTHSTKKTDVEDITKCWLKKATSKKGHI